jgi:outer membrane lipoprotein
MKTTVIAIFALVALAACATRIPPPSGPTPAEVRARGITGGDVHWGGQIATVRNERDRTLIEVLALPLDSDGEPQTDLRPQGRFIVEKAGFLEPQEYASGRLVEVHGRLDGFTDGKVGDSPYRYPVVVGERVRLWGRPGSRIPPRIGIGVGSGGGSWGGVGIGIGF